MLVVAAALVFGGAVVLGVSALAGGVVRALVAVAVVAVGTGVALLPGAALVERSVGTGLVAFGAGLLVSTVDADLPRYGLLALVLLGLALTGIRVWLSGAGALAALALAAVLPDGVLVALAALLALVVVVAPARAWWGDLAGAAASVAILVPASPVAALIAAVLLMVAVVRRDLVTGLLAATVLAVPEPGYAWPLAGIVVVALVAIRVPRVRAAVTRVPALRGTRPAYAVAGAAVVAAGGLVGIALQLPFGSLTLVVVLIAGALGHWLPVPAGPALAVVALVGLGLARPWADLADLPALDVVTALGAWPLLRRHPLPSVFAATAYLVVRVLPPVLGPDPVVAYLLPVVVVGGLAAVLAARRASVPVGQAMGAVLLGVVAFGAWPAVAPRWSPTEATVVVVVQFVLVFALVASTGWRPSAPLAVTAALAMYATMTLAARLTTADGAVASALVVAAAALVVAAWFTARRHASGAGLVHRA